MILNGIDLSALAPQMPARNFPAQVAGRTVHIDADFLAYQSSYEKTGEDKSLADMQHNCATAIETMRKLAAAQYVHLHLTPSSSNKGKRFDLAIQKEYQGNRQDKPKPRYLHMMREWMHQKYPATMHQFCEADDGMSSAQYAAGAKNDWYLSVICSKDKDLNMVPGLHLDWDTGDLVGTTIPDEANGDLDTATTAYQFGEIHLDDTKSTKKIKGYGHKFFWSQMFTGDTADNVQGLPVLCGPQLSKPKKVGPVIAYSLLCGIQSNREAFEYVKLQYERTGQEVGFTHWQTGEAVSWQRVFVSEAQLLWMRRNPHDENDVLQWFKQVLA